MKNEFKAEFLSSSENERFARLIASAFIMELDPTTEELSEIKTAVSEAVTNAVIHGYGKDEGIVTMTGKICDNTVVFTVSDRGKGIENVEKAREPLYTGAPEMERSGMGFTIMEAFTDSLKVESKPGCGTSVIMAKQINGGKNGQ